MSDLGGVALAVFVASAAAVAGLIIFLDRAADTRLRKRASEIDSLDEESPVVAISRQLSVADFAAVKDLLEHLDEARSAAALVRLPSVDVAISVGRQGVAGWPVSVTPSEALRRAIIDEAKRQTDDVVTNIVFELGARGVNPLY